VIPPDAELYWLYAVVNPYTNELLHIQLEPTTNSVLGRQFLAQLREKHDVNEAVFSIDGSLSPKDSRSPHGLDLRVERLEDRSGVKCIF